MKGTLAVVLALCTTLAASELASAKAKTVKIEFRGAGLESPLEITDPEIVRQFSIWIGPGVRINDQPAHLDPNNRRGMFIDWPKGIAATHPKGLERYDVTFHLEHSGAPNEVRRTYLVRYEFDPSIAGGYVYLPGPSDEGYRMNVYSIIHDVEGNWFYSAPTWERLVRPLLESASCHSQAATTSNKRPRRALGSFI